MHKVCIGFSGGLDSSTLLGYFLAQVPRTEVHCVIFDYGSKHGDHEREAAKRVLEYYRHHFPEQVKDYHIDIREVMALAPSALMLHSDREIPEGYYNTKSTQQTVVPGRNLIFASVLASIAESIGAAQIGLGIHSGDHDLYPDCRPEFAKALDTVVYLSSGGKVSVHAPFLNRNKSYIVGLGRTLTPPVPYHLTRSCYQNSEIACGKCGTCMERLEAFERQGISDPIPYNMA